MLIDSHCHLHDREFFTEEQASEMLKRAEYNNVKKIICIGTDPDDSIAARNFAEKYDNVYYTYGVHPNDWQKWQQTTCDQEVERGQFHHGRKNPVAIGEIGLDYHYGEQDKDQQIKLLNEMLQLARTHRLPVSFHIREAFDDFWGVIANFPELKGVIHSFSDNKKQLERILNTTSFFVGVNGMATYSTLPTPPLERILLETDAPFLTPAPFRGIINEPGYVKNIAEWLSTKLGVSVEEIAAKTTENATKLFNL